MSQPINPGVAGAAALFMALSAGAAGAAPPQSTATGIEAQFLYKDIATQLGPIARVAGPPSGKYDVSAAVASVDRRLAIAPKNPTPTFFVNGAGLKSHVSGSGIAIDSRSSEGDNELATGNLSLNIYPLPPLEIATPYPPLLIEVQEALSSANFSVVYGLGAFANGAASFGSLRISGPLVGGQVLTWSGKIAPNTVAFHSPALTIVLNRQVRSGDVSCTPACTFALKSVEVTAIDVALINADIYGTKVSGHIQVNDATAR